MPDPIEKRPDLPETLDAFALIATERVRFGDTDRIGHVNNAVIATYFEVGRTAFLWDPALRALVEGSYFVLARLAIDFHAEITHPGEVRIGTTIVSIGRSSILTRQAIFQNGMCCATADGVIVLVAEATHHSAPLPDAARAYLEGLGS